MISAGVSLANNILWYGHHRARALNRAHCVRCETGLGTGSIVLPRRVRMSHRTNGATTAMIKKALENGYPGRADHEAENEGCDGQLVVDARGYGCLISDRRQHEAKFADPGRQGRGISVVMPRAAVGMATCITAPSTDTR